MPRFGPRDSSGKKGSTMGVLEMEMEPLNGGRTTNNAGKNSDPFSFISEMTNYQKKTTFSMIALALLVGVFLFQIGETAEEDLFGVDEFGHSQFDHVEKKTPSKNFHTTSGSFGGVNNLAHPGGAKAAAKGTGIVFEDIIIPESNVGHAIKSVNKQNILNLWGHYVHDEHRSPYASFLYKAPKEELEERQAKYIEKMKKVREEWGAWDFRDPGVGPQQNTTTPLDDIYRTEANFSQAPYGDLPVEDFPPDSWQADDEYLSNFLPEAKKLVNRVTEGIYAEIGWPKKEDDAAYMEKRAKFLKIHLYDSADCEIDSTDKNEIKKAEIDCGKQAAEGIATMEKHAFEGLVRKLLHAMMTNDFFFAVLGGHSAAAGHGNDFQQNRIITFHHLMEPVFDKLGMKLISRNMAMGGVGTLQFSLAGGDLYGEADIMEWDSGMTESGAPVDMFNKQAILSGERVPLIMTDQPFDIMNESNGTALMGSYIQKNEANLFPETTYENFQNQPWAARWFNEKEDKYNAICWEPRTDYEPTTQQKDHPGSQVGWHPGNRHHQWSGRKLALVLLEALKVAFERWEDGIVEDGCPLAATHWHVKESYDTIRENLRTHINTPKPDADGNDVRSACEKMYPWLPRICRVQMHGFGMWTPRAHVDYDFLNIIKPAPNGYKPEYPARNVYDGFDLLPLSQAIPDGEIDVHAIAIATTSPPPPDLDHSWIEDDADSGGDGTEVKPPTRRFLREASEIGFQKAGESLPPSSLATERRSLQSSPENSMLRRQLDEKDTKEKLDENDTKEIDSAGEIIPGRGWELHGWSPIRAFCDGSAQSECNRDPDQDCLLAAANDKHMDVWGNSLSGWLVFTVPKVREGIILLRMEWWCGGKHEMTMDWTEVNNGMTSDTTPWNETAHREMIQTSMNFNEIEAHRNLKAGPDQKVPKDLKFDYAINGVVKTMEREEWLSYIGEASKNCAAWPVLDDISMAEKDWDGEPVEVAVRFRSELDPHATYCISHVYYA